ncbi:MAG: ribbon-helix-helix protein, CopG family [Candidatus Acidiferrum sp.]|jgi:ribbon-helix-helix CopG family protein
MLAKTEITQGKNTKPEPHKSQNTKVNITLKLDKDLVRAVRVLAAEEGTSVSALLSAKLEEELGRRKEYEKSKRRWFSIRAKGMNLGGRSLSREEMHER